MLQRQNLHVAKTTFTCCKDKKYMLQRNNLYAAKTNLYVTERNMYVIKIKFMFYKDKFICYTNKICMLYRQNLYVVETKSSVLGLSAPAGAFFLPKRDILIFDKTI